MSLKGSKSSGLALGLHPGGYRSSGFLRASKKMLLVSALVSLPLLSACVGQTVNEALDSAALSSPTDLTAMLDNADYVSDFSTVTALPVPARSPISNKLALAGSEQTPAAAAADSVIVAENTPSAPQNADLRTAALASGDPAPLAGAEAQTDTEAAKPAPAPRPVETTTQVAAAPATTPAAKPAPKPKPSGGLFSALFAKKPGSNAAAQRQKKTVNIRNGGSRTANASALPGVKRNSALFGINESDRKRPASEADQNQGVQVASVGSFGRFKTVNGLVLQTERVQVECFKPELMRILKKVERRYGKRVMVTSGYRSPKGNRRAGGVRNSSHIYCKAADIQVEGVSKWDLAKYLRTVSGRGGVGTYCRTKSVHIDVGSVRDWHHPCRRGKSRVKKKKT